MPAPSNYVEKATIEPHVCMRITRNAVVALATSSPMILFFDTLSFMVEISSIACAGPGGLFSSMNEIVTVPKRIKSYWPL